MATKHRELTIDKEFAGMLGLLAKDERAQLEANLKAAGRAYQPIIVWKGHDIIVDGRNRYEYCTEHGLPFEVEEIEFADRSAVAKWIFDNQQGRRNMTPEGLSVLRAKLYEAMKQPLGGKKGAEKSAEKGAENGKSEDAAGKGGSKEAGKESGKESSKESGKEKEAATTAQKVASMTGVSEAQIKLDVKYYQALDSLAGRIRDNIINGDLEIPKNVVYALAKLPKEQQIKIVREVSNKNTTYRAALGLGGPDGRKNPKKKVKKQKVRGAAQSKHEGQRDNIGNEVPESLVAVFERRNDFIGFRSQLKDIAARLRILKANPAGFYLEEEMAVAIEELAEKIGACRPYSLTADGTDWLSEADYKEKAAAG